MSMNATKTNQSKQLQIRMQKSDSEEISSCSHGHYSIPGFLPELNLGVFDELFDPLRRPLSYARGWAIGSASTGRFNQDIGPNKPRLI